ncbi:hypothetical protein [Croceivirga sp. JEA036]|uniref:hypothetical protein n=1 Tax=Croceivirga sp. JEA036 TaxID=2721162 RepID=UPI001ADAC8DA|nr:hypothetical protein [Croceivirga sp. JEA036]
MPITPKGHLTNVELINRAASLSHWLENKGPDHPYYIGVVRYKERLENLLHNPKPSTTHVTRKVSSRNDYGRVRAAVSL